MPLPCSSEFIEAPSPGLCLFCAAGVIQLLTVPTRLASVPQQSQMYAAFRCLIGSKRQGQPHSSRIQRHSANPRLWPPLRTSARVLLLCMLRCTRVLLYHKKPQANVRRSAQCLLTAVQRCAAACPQMLSLNRCFWLLVLWPTVLVQVPNPMEKSYTTSGEVQVVAEPLRLQ